MRTDYLYWKCFTLGFWETPPHQSSLTLDISSSCFCLLYELPLTYTTIAYGYLQPECYIKAQAYYMLP